MGAITQNKRLLFSSLLIFVIFLVSCKGPTSNQTNSDTSTSIAEKAGGLAAAFLSGDSYRCKYNDAASKSSGEYLVKNKKYRVDGQEGVGGAKMSIILNDKGMYMWDVSGKEGFFYPKTEEDKKADDSNKNNSSFDEYMDPSKLDQKEQINCQKAVIDDSQFEPPSNVKFQSFADIFSNLGSSPDSTSIPDSIPGVDMSDLPQE